MWLFYSQYRKCILTEENMDLKEDSLSLEILEEILAPMPNAGFGELIPVLQRIRRERSLKGG